MSNFNPGDPVFVVLRNAAEEPLAAVGYIFIACVDGVVIATRGINGHKDLDYALGYLLSCTQDDEDLPAVAVPVEDCYPTLKAAEEVVENG